MVANEAPTITRMLETVWRHIDYWVIQDNGSKDGTQDIIRDFFAEKGIPGLLYEIEWQYPGWNRDHTLKTCLQTEHGCQWILRMDADEILEVDEDFDWSVLDDLSVDSYNVIAHANGMRYYRTWLWNADRPWFFQHDKRHETIHLPEIGEGFVRVTLPEGFRHVVHSDGQTWNVPRKFLKDALELEIDKVVGNTVKEGEIIAVIYGPFGIKKHTVKASVLMPSATPRPSGASSWTLVSRRIGCSPVAPLTCGTGEASEQPASCYLTCINSDAGTENLRLFVLICERYPLPFGNYPRTRLCAISTSVALEWLINV